MEEDRDNNGKSVSVTMQLEGSYDDVVNKIVKSSTKRPELRDVTEDFGRILDTIDDIDGGTRSVILEHLPEDVSVEHDVDSVVNALQVLERYDLVTLEGNTWNVSR